MSLNSMIQDLPETMLCTDCKGSGKRAAYTSEDGDFHIPERDCYSCKGSGNFSKPDLDAIMVAIKGRNGIRTAKPKNDHRAAYVWRMYRFHTNIDATFPMMFMLAVKGDPYEKILDQFASALARKTHGSDTLGTMRWAKALGYLS